MAENSKVLVMTTATIRFLDYTGSPLTHTPTSVEPSSLLPLLNRARQYERVMQNSLTGAALFAAFDAGLDASGNDITVDFAFLDPNNTTDATTLELLRGLYDDNLTTRTGFSSWVVTNPLTGGGKDTVKMEISVKDTDGGANLLTVPVVCHVQPSVQAAGLHLAVQAHFNDVGALTWS